MNAETLTCSVCKQEVRVVRIGPTTLALGHIRNPKQASHRVRLSRSAQDQSSRAAMGIPAPTEASDHARGRETPGREVSPAAGPHPRSRSRSSGGTTSPARRRVDPSPSPRDGSAPTRSAGAFLTAGD